MQEQAFEQTIEKDWCLRNLVGEAAGRKIDPIADHYLIEQLNFSHTSDVAEGRELECQVRGCDVSCIIRNELGIIQVVDDSGRGACQ
jgi:hypothetical protein